MPVIRAVLEEIAKKYILVVGGEVDYCKICFRHQNGHRYFFVSCNDFVVYPILIDGMIQALQEAVAAAEDTVSPQEKLEIATSEVAFDNGYLAAVQNLAEKIGLSKEGTKDQVYLRILDFFLTVEDQKGDIAKEAHANGVKEARENIRLELQRLRKASIDRSVEAKAAGEKLVLEAKKAVDESVRLANEAETYEALLSDLYLSEKE